MYPLIDPFLLRETALFLSLFCDPTLNVQQMKEAAESLLERLALVGNGTYRLFGNAQQIDLSLTP